MSSAHCGRPIRHFRHRVARTAALAIVLALVSCTGDDEWRGAALGAERLAASPGFYRWDAGDLAGRPGTLVRAERILGAPEGALAWRILFRSRGVDHAPIVASGVVLAPRAQSASPRPVVSWGHPTTGAARHCAPSMGIDPFVLIEGATDFLADGDVVMASDYPGMGARGPWSYLIGGNEGRSLLDAARAAAQIHATGAGDRVLLWGHSQGGHAALFAARDAPVHAPDLDIAAVAVAAPAVELGDLLRDDIDDSAGVALGSYAFWAYHRTYADRSHPPLLGQILRPAGVAATPAMARRCLIGQHAALHRIADPLVGRYLAHPPARVPAWADLLAENTPTAAPYGVPVFVAQGGKDHLVRPGTTADYVRRLCRAGQPVEFHRVPGASHLTIAEDSLGEVRTFFRRALDGAPVATDC